MSDFKRQLIINLSVIAGCLLIFGGIIFFLVADIGRAGSQISAVRENTELRDKEVKTLLALRQEAAEASLLTANLKLRLPTRYDLLAFPKEADRLAKSRNIGLGFSFGSETAGTAETPANINFSMSLSGGLKDALGFLNVIESSVNLTKIMQADIGAGSSQISGLLFFK